MSLRHVSVLICLLSVWVACGKAPVVLLEDCANGSDDNDDGKVDCLDPICFDAQVCVGQVELCDNDIDDNGDGKFDCADPACVGASCGVNCRCVAGSKFYSGTDGGGGAGSTGGGAAGGGTGGSGGGTSGGGSGGGSAVGGGGGGSGGAGGGGTGGGSVGGGTGSRDCVTTTWGTIPHGSSVTAYSTTAPSIGGGKRCQSPDVQQLRKCIDGVLGGTFPFAACRNYSCFYADAGVQNGGWYSQGNGKTFPYSTCQADGGWSAIHQPPQPGVGNFCEWAGVYFVTGHCGYLNDAVYACSSPNWQATAFCPPIP